MNTHTLQNAPTTAAEPAPRAGLPLRGGLWLAQALLSLTYLWAASMKLTQAPAQLAATIPWAADHSQAFIWMTGTADLAAGLGLLLPALTRIAPGLTVWAALGATVLQACAMGFHASRGEFAVLPMNVVMVALQLFVAWGRSRRAPIAPR